MEQEKIKRVEEIIEANGGTMKLEDLYAALPPDISRDEFDAMYKKGKIGTFIAGVVATKRWMVERYNH